MIIGCFCYHLLFFFFKQKTAYEMRISDWSSDVCSDLYAADIFIDCTGDADLVRAAGFPTTKGDVLQPATLWFQLGGVDTDALAHLFQIGRASCRERVCQYV